MRFSLARSATRLIALLALSLCTRVAVIGSQVEEVIVVFKTHFDIGYTDLASNVVHRYRTTMIDDALGVVGRGRDLPANQQFAWTLSGWPFAKIVENWPGQDPQRQGRIGAAYKEGRFVVHALPFTTHTELLEPEELVRGLGYASRVARDNGLSLPRDAKMTDVPSHSWILPTLLRRAGVEFLHLGCNAASRSPEVPLLFWWEGPDGSRLLTMYTAESYGTGLVAPENWPYRTWLALIHTGDNHGPPTPEEVKELLKKADRDLPGVRVRIGRLSDFSDRIQAEQAGIPVVRGDMPDTWIHGPMCDPQGASLARTLRPEMLSAEILGTLLGFWGVAVQTPEEALAKAFEQSLLYSEHTWGGALYWVTGYGEATRWAYGDTWRADRASGRFARLEASWAEHSAYIQRAADLARPAHERLLAALASAVRQPGPRLAVFNPLPWKRTGLVQMEGAVPGPPPPGGSKFPRQLLARDVPALGYTTVVPRAAVGRRTAQSPAEVLENRHFRVRANAARGSIESILDKRTGRELVDARGSYGFGQFLYERFDSNQVAAYVKAYVKIDADWALNELGKPKMPPASEQPYRAMALRNCRLEREADGVQSSVTLRSSTASGVPFPVVLKVSLYDDLPFLDLEVTIENKPADPWPEAGWICLPFNLQSPQFRVGRQASIIDPAKDIVRGANRHMYAVNTGVAVFGPDGHGAGFCPVDSPLVSLGEPGCWKYSFDYVPEKPVAFINLFNNQWTTNFRLWNEGRIVSRVRLWSFEEYEPENALIRPGLEARYPLQAGFSEAAPGRLPEKQAGLGVDCPGALVTAFGSNPDGDGTLLRMWEMAGRRGAVNLELPAQADVSRALRVNLRGEPSGEPVLLKRGRMRVEMDPFAPMSIVLER